MIDRRLDEWKSRLLDLSRRNRLLYFRPVQRGNLPIVEPTPEELYDLLVKQEKKLTFAMDVEPDPAAPAAAPVLAPAGTEDAPAESPAAAPASTPAPAPRPAGQIRTGLTPHALANTLYNIRAKAHTALEEQGVNVLYVTFGMLKWYGLESASELIESPLILVPVELTRASGTRAYTLELIDEDILVNPTLLYKLQTDLRLSFPPLPEDWTATTLAEVLAQCQEMIKNQRNWSLSPEAHLGLFSFEKLVMLKDLQAHAGEAMRHALVVALAGDRTLLPALPRDLPSADTLDTTISPAETYQVLDADSSQQEAIALARCNVSFVIQGPPGTGKSQTIANIIAESLAQGKKVLFVSEKMAALEVVYKRLAESNLAEFCLEAHSHKANKGAIVAQLGKSLNSAVALNADSFQTELAQVSELRTRLNQYAQALHESRPPLGWSAFYVHGQLMDLRDAPELHFLIDNVAKIDTEQLLKMRSALDSLLAESEIWDNYEEHPWHGATLRSYSFQNQTDIQLHFRDLIHCLDELSETSSQLAQLLELPVPGNIAQVQSFSQLTGLITDTPYPCASWFKERKPSDLRRAARTAQEVFDEHRMSRGQLLPAHTEAILGLKDLSELVTRFETNYRSRLRWFNSQYRSDMRRIQATLVPGHKANYEQILASLKLALRVQNARQWIDEHAAEHATLFEHMYKGLDTRWDTILHALEWTDRFKQHFSSAPLPDGLIDLVCKQPETVRMVKDDATHLSQLLDRTRKELAFMGTIFPMSQTRISGTRIHQVDFARVQEWAEYRLDHLKDLKTWIDFETARRECDQAGLGPFLQAALAAKIKSDQLQPAFFKRLYRQWLDAIYEEDPVLRDFSSAQHNKAIEQFAHMDREQLAIAQKRITRQLAALRPKASWVEAPSSEVVILRRELEKKKRHKPIRKLFAEIPHLLLTLKPCLMMSPLSVSQFLSAGHYEFDVVIFDEASQISPEDAIGAVMRGQQVIVAGDRHQLPPTPFFRSLGIDFDDWSEEDAQADILESLLQECSVNLPDQMLKWHYRSRHESLIAFSNHHLYDDQLITFPQASTDGDPQGLEFLYVADGIYDRGKSRQNRVEAKRVAELILEHFTCYPERSLGVVAFSEAQREAIDDELRQLTDADPDFELFVNQKGPEAFFVKNLENVQGDERDVIFFSVGYGRDAAGHMTLNFGPLNGEDGARRLNVAITRARLHVKLVSSILPDDIDPDHPNHGVQLLRQYMQYARQGGRQEALIETDAAPVAEMESPFEAAVRRALAERGLTVHSQVGRSGFRIDLAIEDPENPGRYLLGILCDGAMYRSAKTARDRDRLRQQLLEERGWRIHRIWSRDWVTNPEDQIQAILDLLNKGASAPIGKPAVAADQPSEPAPQPRDAAAPPAPALPKGVKLYTYATLNKRGNPEQFYQESSQTIGRLLVRLVEAEGPIHLRSACRRVAGCWGVNRVGKSIEARITRVAQFLASRKNIELRDEFLWPVPAGEVMVRRAPEGEAPRPIDEIALEEIAQAAFLSAQDAYSLTRDDLVTQTARLLGYDRTGDKVRERILVAVERLIAENRVAVSGDKIEPVKG